MLDRGVLGDGERAAIGIGERDGQHRGAVLLHQQLIARGFIAEPCRSAGAEQADRRRLIGADNDLTIDDGRRRNVVTRRAVGGIVAEARIAARHGVVVERDIDRGRNRHVVFNHHADRIPAKIGDVTVEIGGNDEFRQIESQSLGVV